MQRRLALKRTQPKTHKTIQERGNQTVSVFTVIMRMYVLIEDDICRYNICEHLTCIFSTLSYYEKIINLLCRRQSYRVIEKEETQR